MKGKELSVKGALNKIQQENNKGDIELDKLQAKKGTTTLKSIATNKVDSKDALLTIRKSFDTIDLLTKSYAELVKNCVSGKAEVKAEKSEDKVADKKDETKESEKSEEKENKDDKEVSKEDKVKKDFKEEDKENIAKSKVATEDKENVNKSVDNDIEGSKKELISFINKSLENLNEADERVDKLNKLNKSISEAKELDSDALQSFVDTYNEI